MISNLYNTLFLVSGLLLFPLFVYAQNDVDIYIADFAQEELRKTMEENASMFLSEINNAFGSETPLQAHEQGLTENFLNAFEEIWNNTPFYIPEERIIETVSKLTTGSYEMRNIPAYFVDPDGEEYYEEAVLQFTPSGLISEFRIGLAAHRYKEVMEKGEDVIDIGNRETILSFVENFRTAYNRKDLDYINTVFSDQALIIVGKVVESTGEESAYQQQVEYLQLNKDEYIERLEILFNRNEWINVGYEDVGIIRHPKHPDIYGVSLTQYYSSSTYSDEGYLFLLIDFKDPDQPMIHVRTWQPKEVTPEDEVFHIGFMEIF
ncbi:MAG: hypothetical protein MI700_06405 [Balneolales bacterium]|nr:hypothetical protein [Balneolales bacterium]